MKQICTLVILHFYFGVTNSCFVIIVYHGIKYLQKYHPRPVFLGAFHFLSQIVIKYVLKYGTKLST